MKRIQLTEEEAEEEDIAEEINYARRRSNFSFSELEIPLGAELEFTGNREIKCKVISDKKVDFEGRRLSISALANELKETTGLSGSYYFFYEDEILIARRARLKRKRQSGRKQAMEE